MTTPHVWRVPEFLASRTGAYLNDNEQQLVDQGLVKLYALFNEQRRGALMEVAAYLMGDYMMSAVNHGRSPMDALADLTARACEYVSAHYESDKILAKVSPPRKKAPKSGV